MKNTGGENAKASDLKPQWATISSGKDEAVPDFVAFCATGKCKRTFDRCTLEKAIPKAALTLDEQATLDDCEAAIRTSKECMNGLFQAFYRISNQHLYKADFETFDEYCRVRWGIFSSHRYCLAIAGRLNGEMAHDGDMPPHEKTAQSGELNRTTAP